MLIKKIREGKKPSIVYSYFLSFSPNFAASPHEIRVKPIGNTPLDRTDEIPWIDNPLLLYAARTIGKTAKPTTLIFVLVGLPSLFVCIFCAVI